MLPVFHRSLGGRVTAVELLPAEFACAVAACPWKWAADPKSFKPWPPTLVRGTPVVPASLADEPKLHSNSLWKAVRT
jgi:hypothetical protein